MPITLTCANPSCAKLLQVPDSAAGQLIRCPVCGHTQTAVVPAVPVVPVVPAVPLEPLPAAPVVPAAPLLVAPAVPVESPLPAPPLDIPPSPSWPKQPMTAAHPTAETNTS